MKYSCKKRPYSPGESAEAAALYDMSRPAVAVAAAVVAAKANCTAYLRAMVSGAATATADAEADAATVESTLTNATSACGGGVVVEVRRVVLRSHRRERAVSTVAFARAQPHDGVSTTTTRVRSLGTPIVFTRALSAAAEHGRTGR